MKTSAVADKHTKVVVRELGEAMTRGNAHSSFEYAVKDIPHELLDKTPAGLPYSIWQLVEHIRITQWDILDFCRNPQYKSMRWPDDYWPKEKGPAHPVDFSTSVDQILADRKAFIDLLHKADDEALYTPFPHGDGQNLFREALLIIDHNSYHIGEVIVIRRLLQNWK
ncbi:MAG TPA: DinB family protein [Puia sp.]|nr:DinB family protein [Puia sp.]